MTTWPDIIYPEIFHYLIESLGIQTKESMRSFKSLDIYNYFDSGFVRTIFSMKLGSKKLLMKTEVNHSQQTSEPPCKVWNVLHANGSVIASHGTCMAGYGEACSHIGGNLYRIESCVRNKYSKKPCTSRPCEWDEHFSKKVEAARINDMDFSKPKHKQGNQTKPPPKKIKNKKSDPLSHCEQENF